MSGLGLFSGLKSWAHRNIKTISGITSLISPLLGQAILALDSYINSKITDSDLIQSDQDILTPWEIGRAHV